VVAAVYARDNLGAYPTANGDNPGTFKFTTGAAIDQYLKANGIAPAVWYCPMSEHPQKQPEFWMNHNQHWDSSGEFPIGYFYIANPSRTNKFRRAVPTSVRTVSAKLEVAFDQCAAVRPSPGTGAAVAVWTQFPHFGRAQPRVCQLLMGDLGVRTRKADETGLGYEFVAPVDIYW